MQYNIGYELFVSERYEEAIFHFDNAIRLDEHCYDAMMRKAECFYKLDNLQAVCDSYTSAIQLYPNVVDPYYLRGQTFEMLSRFQDAINDYNKAVSLEPFSGQSYLMRGRLYQQLGLCEEAMKDYDKAIDVDAKTLNAYLLQYSILLDKREVEGAIRKRLSYNQVAGNAQDVIVCTQMLCLIRHEAVSFDKINSIIVKDLHNEEEKVYTYILCLADGQTTQAKDILSAIEDKNIDSYIRKILCNNPQIIELHESFAGGVRPEWR